MSGNGFLIRCKELIVDRNLLRSESDFRKVGFGTAAKYTAVQVRIQFLTLVLCQHGAQNNPALCHTPGLED